MAEARRGVHKADQLGGRIVGVRTPVGECGRTGGLGGEDDGVVEGARRVEAGLRGGGRWGNGRNRSPKYALPTM